MLNKIHPARIELAPTPWKGAMIPFHHGCFYTYKIFYNCIFNAIYLSLCLDLLTLRLTYAYAYLCLCLLTLRMTTLLGRLGTILLNCSEFTFLGKKPSFL